MGFGENELGRRLTESPVRRQRIRECRSELDHLVLDALKDTVTHLGLPKSDEADLGRMYQEAVTRLGVV